GPIPSDRSVMNRVTSTTNVPMAYTPPRAVRRKETWGWALSAMVAMVPDGAFGTMEPPGVSVGVAVTAWRATRLTYAVARIAGSPSSITSTAPGKTQSGSPIPTTAALARIATAAVARA